MQKSCFFVEMKKLAHLDKKEIWANMSPDDGKWPLVKKNQPSDILANKRLEKARPALFELDLEDRL